MTRATELWRNEISGAMKWRNMSNNYIEIKYEDLVLNTERVLIELCDFLKITYTKEMLTLRKPTEKYGLNSKKNSVGKTSLNRYEEENKKVIKRIEEIAYPLMKILGYEVKYAEKYCPMSKYRMFILKFIDFINYKIANKIKGY